MKQRIREILRTLTPRPQSLAATMMALAILSAAAGAGVFGPDAQRLEERTNPVGEADAFACGGACIAVGVGAAVGFGVGYVADEYFSGDDTSDVFAQTDATETHIEVSTHADSVARSQKTLNVVMSNQVQDGSRTVAWSKGKAAAVKALNDGANKTEAQAAAKAAVSDYYHTMEMNLINSRNDAANKTLYLDEVYNSQGSLSGSFGDVENTNAEGGFDTVQGYNFTTVNGTVVKVYIPRNLEASSGIDGNAPWTPSSRTEGAKYDDTNDLTVNYEANVTPSRGDDIVIDISESQTLFNDIESADSQMRSNLDLWVDNIYADYTAGDINSSDILDPTTLAQEFSTSYNSTGYYGYAAGDLAVMGVNGTFNESFTIVSNGTTYNGTLFTDWAPANTNGSFVTGTTYNISNADSPVYVATNDGLTLLTDDFTIQSMTNVKTGESTNSTSLEDYHRQTADASVGLTQEQLNQLLEIRQTLDEQQAAAGSGGGLFGGLGNIGSTPILLALGAAVVLLLGRNQ